MSSYAMANGLDIGIYDNITFRATQKWQVVPLKVQQEQERQKSEEHQEEDTEQNVEILYL